MQSKLRVIPVLLILLCSGLLVSCQPGAVVLRESTPTGTATVAAATPTAQHTLTPTQSPVPSQTPEPTATPFPQPEGCLRPPDDYNRVEINGWTLNVRTLAMLQHAADLYGGDLDLVEWGVTQGSYHDNGSLSFGTHLGGGAVDLSVMRPGTWEVLWDDIEPVIHALRVAGFAAWFRDYGEVYPDSAYHIHAIAIGDAELSQAAVDQLVGPYGYFRGFTGLPTENQIPIQDRHGGPILCQWMAEMGYRLLDPAVP